jgi:hypothetical protein
MEGNDYCSILANMLLAKVVQFKMPCSGDFAPVTILDNCAWCYLRNAENSLNLDASCGNSFTIWVDSVCSS